MKGYPIKKNMKKRTKKREDKSLQARAGRACRDKYGPEYYRSLSLKRKGIQLSEQSKEFLKKSKA